MLKQCIRFHAEVKRSMDMIVQGLCAVLSEWDYASARETTTV